MFTDPLDTDDDLHLRHFVDGVDVGAPGDPVQIALVDAVNAQEAGAAIGEGFAPLTDGDGCGAGLLDVRALALSACRMTQGVDLAIGDVGEAFDMRGIEDAEDTLAELACRETGACAGPRIDLGQPREVLGEIAATEGVGRASAPVTHLTAVGVLVDEARHLCTGETGELAQGPLDDAVVGVARRR